MDSLGSVDIAILSAVQMATIRFVLRSITFSHLYAYWPLKLHIFLFFSIEDNKVMFLFLLVHLLFAWFVCVHVTPKIVVQIFRVTDKLVKF